MQYSPIISHLSNQQKSNRSFVLTPTQIGVIASRLHLFMQQEKPFLRFRYSIRDLADNIQIPSYQLSAFLNSELGIRFNDYFNQFRVGYCKDLIITGATNQLNLKGLALKCGFNNRNTLTTAFKKFTGFTPSEYVRIEKIITQ